MLRLIFFFFPVSPPPITPEAGIPWNMMSYKTIKKQSTLWFCFSNEPVLLYKQK